MIIKCSMCKKTILRDRYNLSWVLERQDDPGKSDWQKSTDMYRENVCPRCQQIISQYVHGFLEYFREHKGDIKN